MERPFFSFAKLKIALPFFDLQQNIFGLFVFTISFLKIQ